MQINQTTDNGYTVYKFAARGVSFEVLTRDGIAFDVYSNQIGRAGRTPATCYDSLAHLATRSKTFANFAALIAA